MRMGKRGGGRRKKKKQRATPGDSGGGQRCLGGRGPLSNRKNPEKTGVGVVKNSRGKTQHQFEIVQTTGGGAPPRGANRGGKSQKKNNEKSPGREKKKGVPLKGGRKRSKPVFLPFPYLSLKNQGKKKGKQNQAPEGAEKEVVRKKQKIQSTFNHKAPKTRMVEKKTKGQTGQRKEDQHQGARGEEFGDTQEKRSQMGCPKTFASKINPHSRGSSPCKWEGSRH